MRVLVCGDRHWSNYEMLYRTLDALWMNVGDLTVISGMAKGADSWAAKWAADRKQELLEFPADWARLGRAAGPVRNRRMLVEGKPELVIAFHEAITSSKGTADMVRQAEKAGVEVWLMGDPEKVFDG